MVQKKRCKYCHKLYPEISFGVALTTSAKVYRRRKCRNCYRATKQALIRRYQQWIIEYKKQQKCCRCGVSDYRVLDFHHKNEDSKRFSLGNFRRGPGFNRIKGEVKKCEVICANCHRILHYREAK